MALFNCNGYITLNNRIIVNDESDRMWNNTAELVLKYLLHRMRKITKTR
jgi:hypothetical protein